MNFRLPGSIVLVTEDHVIRPHLDDAMELVVSNEILNSIGATKVLDVVTALKVDGVEDFRLNLLAGAGNATGLASVGVESEGF